MNESFTCSICGQKHDGLLTDWAYKLPDEVWKIPEAERPEKARFNNDLCQFNDRNFIRCVLDVPLIETSANFGWGAWAEVDGRHSNAISKSMMKMALRNLPGWASLPTLCRHVRDRWALPLFFDSGTRQAVPPST